MNIVYVNCHQNGLSFFCPGCNQWHIEGVTVIYARGCCVWFCHPCASKIKAIGKKVMTWAAIMRVFGKKNQARIMSN